MHILTVRRHLGVTMSNLLILNSDGIRPKSTAAIRSSLLKPAPCRWISARTSELKLSRVATLPEELATLAAKPSVLTRLKSTPRHGRPARCQAIKTVFP